MQVESDADRLRRTITPGAMSVGLVSAYAGDRVMTKSEKTLVNRQKDERGKAFFSDLLYTISHHYFAPEIADALWNEILQHKFVMSQRLARNVRITVATLDYLSNITSDFTSPTLISEAHVSEMAALSMRDGMTGLYNHTSCYELLELECRAHGRHGTGLSLILLDIDDFKLVNDRYGHQEGDRILIALAKTLTEQVRDSDICCRLGGEEFIVILPFTGSLAEACEVAERIRERSATITCGAKGITISAGVAVADRATGTPRELIEKADRALYGAKKSGKNMVVADVVRNR